MTTPGMSAPVQGDGLVGLHCLQANFRRSDHAAALVHLLDGYARDPMGGGQALPEAVLQALPRALAERPFMFSVLAYAAPHGQMVPVGLINCVEGFSTFACRPVVNLHDVVVDRAYRGRGVSRQMLIWVEKLARERGACKLTLEVLTGNLTAMAVYRRNGFVPYQLDPSTGQAIFMQKSLADPGHDD